MTDLVAQKINKLGDAIVFASFDLGGIESYKNFEGAIVALKSISGTSIATLFKPVATIITGEAGLLNVSDHSPAIDENEVRFLSAPSIYETLGVINIVTLVPATLEIALLNVAQ